MGKISTREKILNATKDLLWAHGYEAMSPAQVMKVAGVGQGSLYHHFPTKRTLTAAAIEEVVEEFSTEQEAVLSQHASAKEQIAALVTRPRRGTKGCRLGRLIADEAVQSDPELRELIQAFFDASEATLTSLIGQAQEGGEIRSDIDPRQAAKLLLSAVQGGFVLSRIHNEDAEITQTTEAALRLLEVSNG